MKQEYKILGIDVWCDGDEGFLKNDFFEIGRILIDEKEDVIDRLIEEEYLSEKTHNILECEDLDGMSEYYEITHDGAPLLDLAITHEYKT